MSDESNSNVDQQVDEAAPVEIDTSPLAVLGATQALRMQAIMSRNPHDKELERIAANADRTALGQMRITVDEQSAEADRALKQSLIEAITIPTANPFQVPAGQSEAGQAADAPQLGSSIDPSAEITEENMSVGIGSPAIEEVIGAEGVERMLENSK